MARIPVYEEPLVKPIAAPDQAIRVSVPSGLAGGATGQALEQVGGQLGKVANLFDRRVEELRKEDDAAKVLQTYTQATDQTRTLLYNPDNGLYTKRGGDAMGASATAQKSLDEVYRNSLGTLRSPEQQRAFTAMWTRHSSSELDGLARHEAKERQDYRDQVSASLVKGAADDAANRYNDPLAVDLALETADRAIIANTKGLPPDAIKLQQHQAHSGIQKAVVLRQMVADPLGAEQYYKDHADEFTADDHILLQRALEPKVQHAQARKMADDIVAGTTTGGPAGAKPGTAGAGVGGDRLNSAVEQTESTGVQTAVSKAGNYGVMQINDASGKEAADALGIPWDPKKARTDATYNRQLGQKYLQIQRDKYGNDTLALAAYNAGPGKVQEWITQFGDPRTGQISEQAWVAKLPFAETRGYIAKVNALVRDPTHVDFTRASAEVDKIQDPELRERVRTEIEHKASDFTRQKIERERAARDRAQNIILAGGRFEDVPGEVLADMDPVAQSSLQTLEARLRKGHLTTDRDTYLQLSDLAGKDPQAFLTYDLNGAKDKLSDSDWQHFADLRRAYLAAGEKGEAAKAGERTRHEVQTDTLRAAGVDPTPKDTDTKGAMKVKLFNEALDREVRAFKVQNPGKQPTSEDIQKMADKLVIKGVLKGTGWIWDDPAYAFELTPETAPKFIVSIDKIPALEKTDITAELGRRKIPVSNALVEQIYSATLRGDKAAVNRLLTAPAATTPTPAPPPATADTVPNPLL
jgi:soluble lytic murein transglycosylase